MTGAVTSQVALVFPGQGSQRVGMLDTIPDKAGIAGLLEYAESLSGLELRAIAAEGPDTALADTRAAQPLLFIAGWAWASAITEAGIRPTVVAGHSLGELTALAVAGVFDVASGLELVVERSRAMAEAAAATPGTMAAVLGMDSSVVSDLVAPLDGVWIANDNAPGQIVLTGTHAGIEIATHALSEAGARKIVPLSVAGPFHSPLMESAAEEFARVLESTPLREATVPILQNTTARAATDPDVIRARLRDQIVSPVRWTETMMAILDRGIPVMVEAGPGAVLTGLGRRVEGLSAYAAETVGIEKLREEVAA